MPLHFTNPVELRSMKEWDRAIAIALAKAQSATIHPTRKSNGNDISYPAIPNALSEVDIFGRNIVNKPGIYPYGSATGTTPVASTSLKAGTYKRARIKGKGVTKRKQAALWGRYAPCEYIGFDGLPYIDLAPLTTESDIEITFRRRDGYTQTNFLFGTNPNNPTDPVVGAWYGSQGLVVQNGSVRNNSSLDTNWHTLKVTSTKTYLDGAELASAGDRTTLQNLIIGSARDERTGTVDSRCFHGDISRVKVGNKIFVAGKDVTANTFGLFDPAENKFYGNSGTGTITGGSLIQPISSISGVTPSTNEMTVRVGTNGYLLDTTTWALTSVSGTLGADIPMTELAPDIIETNVGDALYGYADGVVLPSEYERVEYVTNTNTGAIIETSLKANSYTTFKIKTRLKHDNSQTTSYTGTNFGYWFGKASGKWTIGGSVYSTDVTGNWQNVEVLSTKTSSTNIKITLTVDGVSATRNYSIAGIPTGNYRLFGISDFANGLAIIGSSADWEIYGDDVLVGHFITVKRGTTYGFYDLVSKQFYGNTGVVAFTGGPVIPRTLHPSGEQTVTVGDQTRTITTFLPSANSFIDAQKPSNNVECDWKIVVMDGVTVGQKANSVSTYNNLYRMNFVISDGVAGNVGVIDSTHFDPMAADIIGALKVAGGTTILAYYADQSMTTVAQVNAWLKEKYDAGHPVIFVYKLATPEVTTVTLSEFTQPLGTVTILNEFADGTKGAVDFYGVNVQIDTPVPKHDEPYPLLSNVGEVKVGYIQTQGKVIYDGSSDEVWTYDSGFQRFYLGSASLPADMKLGGTRTQQMFAPNWRCLWHGEAVSTAVNGDFYVGSNNVFFHSPETSVAAFKAMLQTNPIELYYQRTDDPSFVQPTNGFFGDGQQTAKMESKNLFDVGARTYHMYYDGNGVYQQASGSDVSDFIKVKPNTQYVISGERAATSGARRVNLFDSNKTWTSQPVNQTTYPLLFTTDATTEWVRFSYYDGNNGPDTNLQMEEGSTATTHTPYVTPQTVTTSEILPSATSKLNMQGGPDNKDCDWVFKQLDGTESGWGYSSTAVTGHNAFTLSIDDTSRDNEFVPVSSHYVGRPASTPFSGLENEQFKHASASSTYYFVDDRFDNVTAFKAWLAVAKPIIAYKRSSSELTTVTTQRLEITAKKIDLTITSQFSDGASADLAVTYLGDPEPPPRAVKFTAEQANSTIALAGATGTNYKYSTDGKTFNAYTSGTTITLANIGDAVWFQGVHNENVTYSWGVYSHFIMTGNVAASGNINWLLDPRFDDEYDTLPSLCYYLMFDNCTGLMTAPELPAKKLASYCYRGMFRGCTNLTIAPDLPATTLVMQCYYQMFYGCSSLTTAPELPATTLVDSGYYMMFYGCTSLTAAPALLATTLATSCYFMMFYNCTSLTTAPDLPATTLVSGCYNQMFVSCTNLTTAPELPATTLVTRCYYLMFSEARNLNYVVIHATNISATSCLSFWLQNVKSTGTLKCPASLVLESGASGLPSGWTRVNL